MFLDGPVGALCSRSACLICVMSLAERHKLQKHKLTRIASSRVVHIRPRPIVRLVAKELLDPLQLCQLRELRQVRHSPDPKDWVTARALRLGRGEG